MKCPACGGELSPVHTAVVDVDACDGGCGGLWFGPARLRRFLAEPVDLLPTLVPPWNPSVRVDPAVKRPCPQCPGILMLKRFYSIAREAEIDECGKCGGIWLDRGELEAIRSAYGSEEERRKAEQAWRAASIIKTEPRGAPQSALPYFSRHIHRNPLGMTGYRSADRGMTAVEDLADAVEAPPVRNSPWRQWGIGLGVAGVLILGGLATCLSDSVTVYTNAMNAHLHRDGIVLRGWGAVGRGLMALSAGLFLHTHYFWSAVRALLPYARTGKILSVVLLIAGLALYVLGLTGVL